MVQSHVVVHLAGPVENRDFAELRAVIDLVAAVTALDAAVRRELHGVAAPELKAEPVLACADQVDEVLHELLARLCLALNQVEQRDACAVQHLVLLPVLRNQALLSQQSEVGGVEERHGRVGCRR